ncbi:MAG: PAS domain S-box protein [Thiotrichales bacterium]|nr:PAS domain S-box protein [Thiotrichales bacterium]
MECYDALLDNGPLGVIIWDVSQFPVKPPKITSWNKRAEIIFGFTANEAIGQTFELIVEKDAIDLVNLIFQDLITQRGGYRSCNKNVRKNGQIITCDWYNQPIEENGRVVCIISGILDVTRCKTGGKACNDLESLIDVLLQSVPGTACLVDNDGKYKLVNSTLSTLLGIRANHIIGMPVGFAGDLEFQNKVLSFLDSNLREDSWESPHRELWFKIGAKKISAGTLLIGLDITKIKTLQKQLQEEQEKNSSFLKIIEELVDEDTSNSLQHLDSRIDDLEKSTEKSMSELYQVRQILGGVSWVFKNIPGGVRSLIAISILGMMIYITAIDIMVRLTMDGENVKELIEEIIK